MICRAEVLLHSMPSYQRTGTCRPNQTVTLGLRASNKSLTFATPVLQKHGLNQKPRRIRPWVILLSHARAKSVGAANKVTTLHAETIPQFLYSPSSRRTRTKNKFGQTNGAETEMPNASRKWERELEGEWGMGLVLQNYENLCHQRPPGAIRMYRWSYQTVQWSGHPNTQSSDGKGDAPTHPIPIPIPFSLFPNPNPTHNPIYNPNPNPEN